MSTSREAPDDNHRQQSNNRTANGTTAVASCASGGTITTNQPGLSGNASNAGGQSEQQHHLYNHHFFHNHHPTYGDYEESFEIHERLTKESLLLRADTTLKTRYWLQMLRYHAKDLGHWRQRRPALANIMMMRQD
jgi:hypothetical protein